MKKNSLVIVLVGLFFMLIFSSCATNATTAVATATAEPTFPYSDIVSVPGGTFTQTDTAANSFQHTISAFKLGKYEVTYDLWYTVKAWALGNGYNFANEGMEGGAAVSGAAPTAAKYQPVTKVYWRDVIVWCNAYSEKSGLASCYTYLGDVIKDSRDANATACDNAVCIWSNTGYRLPTEGEWQYAASYEDGSSWTAYNYASGATANYNDAIATGLVAWYDPNASYVTHNVGGKNANNLGIYDMCGNVQEWCWDIYGTYPGTSTNYKGFASGSSRVLRGGDFNYAAILLQIGYRGYCSYIPGVSNHSVIGFRFARTN